MANLFDLSTYPSTEPSNIIAGDQLAWKRTDLSDYPTADYWLTYAARLEGDGATKISIDTTGVDNEYKIVVGRLLTEEWPAGRYQWQAYITRKSDNERITIDFGVWEVFADRLTATTDPRSHVKKVLDSIEAVIEGRATKDQESYSIGNRSLAHTPIPDLLVMRDKYKAEWVSMQRAERAGRGLGNTSKIKVRF